MVCGCTVGPDFRRPEPPESKAYTRSNVQLPGAGHADPKQSLVAGAVVSKWWELFHSQTLDKVLALAIEGSPTLDAARASLAQAQQAIAEARGALYPQVDLNAAATRERVNTSLQAGASTISGNVFNVGPTVSYGPDVFGGTRRLIEQQSALAEVQRYELAAAYLSLTGNAATQAINIGAAREQIQAVQEILAIDEKNLELVRIEQEIGKAAQADVLNARSVLASDQALLPPIRQQLSVARHALSILVGKSPAAWSPPDFDLEALSLPTELPVSLPSELVRERPDILAAEAQMHAATAAIGVATARLYPSITLSASWTLESASMGTLFDSSGGLWSVAADLTAPVFHGGALEAQRRAAENALAVQLAMYRQTVLQAFGQVADVLRALQHDAEAIAAQQYALETAQASLELTQESYAAGQASFLLVLEVQRLYQQARLGYARARSQRYLDSVQLFVAMGGGWRGWNDPALSAGTGSK
jgi:NodT family efflux transporter outer membrane factor (OMF) lipoprotein